MTIELRHICDNMMTNKGLSPCTVLNFPFLIDTFYWIMEIAEASLVNVLSVKKSENSYFGGLKFGK